MYAVVHAWLSAFLTGAIGAVCAVFLYFAWWRRLPETGDSDVAGR